MTLAELLTQITTTLSGFVPDLAIYISGGVIVGLVAVAGKKLLKIGR